MKYDAYFHNDFDGRASAAVMLAFLRSRGDGVEHFTPIDFHLEKQWLSRSFFKQHKLFKGKRNSAIVVDFLYHPDAAWWFDHHETTFKKEAWGRIFRPDRQHVLAPQYRSCCHLVYDSLVKGFGWKAPQHIKELVRVADIIDGAGYKTARETIYLKGPMMAIDAFIEETHHDLRKARWMVELLAARPLAKIAALPEIKKIAKKARDKNIKALNFYEKNMKVFKNATFIDVTNAHVGTLRYASYYLHPKVRYAIRMTIKNGRYHIGIGSNPWLKRGNPVHLGRLLSRYGGGGHKDAAATDISSREAALRAVPEIVAMLNKK